MLFFHGYRIFFFFLKDASACWIAPVVFFFSKKSQLGTCPVMFCFLLFRCIHNQQKNSNRWKNSCCPSPLVSKGCQAAVESCVCFPVLNLYDMSPFCSQIENDKLQTEASQQRAARREKSWLRNRINAFGQMLKIINQLGLLQQSCLVLLWILELSLVLICDTLGTLDSSLSETNKSCYLTRYLTRLFSSYFTETVVDEKGIKNKKDFTGPYFA